MNAKVRISDVAKEAGVSVTTVSQILNGKGQRFSEQTRNRVYAVRDQLGYVPDFNARNLITRSAKTIGVLVPNIGNPFFSTFIRGIEKQAMKSQFIPVIFGAENDPDVERYYIEELIKRTVDGLIIASPTVGQEEMDHLLDKNHIPYLLIDQNPLNAGDRIETDDKTGACLAMRHLLELGHRKIALVFPKEPSDNIMRRYQGYCDILAEYQIEPQEDLLITTELTKKGGYLAAAELVKTDATAVFAANDELAIGLYRGLKERGKKIPEDYSIVGYDNIDLSQYVDPPLTTVEQPVYEMGKIAFQKLVERIKEPQKEADEILLPVKLITRQSTRELK
ncbi:ribose utilization transcriptional repressor RbsR [Ligilactobacillus ceti]|uniref:Transcriptional regulator n=1 Tax=Ligilactobacillus ceti DSM 22408 TaxID=1122146 RepID=A0A0R2KIN0_9LACO|nr:LacI family DNA-binding transcriptional regulator [Ligilactobacillus ceti]KRN89250.1 transcriptional regulator [Ligilactobacillus ceti DSM 22408]